MELNDLIHMAAPTVYKSFKDKAPNGNYIGECKCIVNGLDVCLGVYNIDQYFDKTAKTQIKTGACAGSNSLIDVYTSVVNDQPIFNLNEVVLYVVIKFIK